MQLNHSELEYEDPTHLIPLAFTLRRPLGQVVSALVSRIGLGFPCTVA